MRLLQAPGPGRGEVVNRPLAAGEMVLLVDRKGRRYVVKLAAGGEFHTHAGAVAHDELIGREEGVSARSTGGTRLSVVRPRSLISSWACPVEPR